ncbi:MAG: TonB-dependent receptor, partial [Verrucomicrobiales bacterium]|nr:TonB-dependent receptor [Verrucomicrobiales bacterium]
MSASPSPASAGREPAPSPVRWPWPLLRWWTLAWLCVAWLPPGADAAVPATPLTSPTSAPSSEPSRLVEVSGQVELATAGQADWHVARVGQALPLGSRVRTHAASRATLQFSDRSVLRLGPSSLVVVQPPRSAPATKRFRLDLGRLFFLDREAPSDIEFETPVATGAIRGTEFVLSSGPETDASSLALLDGVVEIQQDTHQVTLKTGDLVELRRGQPPRVSRLILAANLIQWCLYYPVVLVPADLTLSPSERQALAASLDAWSRGATREAWERHPGPLPEGSPDATAYHAALLIAAAEIEAAEGWLARLPLPSPTGDALRELLAAVRFQTMEAPTSPSTASGWLARSYYLQSRSDLPAALAAARKAAELAPTFGPAWIRVAELEHTFEHRRAALEALERGLQLAPESATGHALQGFLALAGSRPREARSAFDRALELDGALGNAWLGRALTAGRMSDPESARQALQVATALEPNRAELRSYLGRAWAEAGDATRAASELELASTLDPGDPTPRLFSALERFQNSRPNEAVRQLERSLELNDRRSVLRSRRLLDRDRSSRSADLASLFHAVGLEAPARALAARAVQEDAANFSAHLLLARSLQFREDPWRANLRFETPRQSELLLANLLAPVEAGNLSQQLSQHDRLRYFASRPLGFSSFTEYQSGGDWDQLATAFGTVDRLSYALDFQYGSHPGDHPNAHLDQRRLSLQVKQQVAPDDELYLQIGTAHTESGDVFTHADPATTDPDLDVTQRQEPHGYVGWHHTWSPANHTLLLASWLHDDLSLSDARRPILFLRQSGGVITAVDTERAAFDLEQRSTYALRSVEAQHLWESPEQGVVAGVRYQSGDLDTDATLTGPLPPAFARQHLDTALERVDVYADYSWRPLPQLRFTAGAGYHHLRHPGNADLPPLSTASRSRDLLAPRLGATWSPLPRTHLRAAHAQSLGGLYFDDSIRLEPTQLAGFTTALR